MASIATAVPRLNDSTGPRGLGMRKEKDRRNQQRHDRQQQLRGVDPGMGAVEPLHAVLQAAEQQAGPHHQQHVADDRTGDGRLHQIQQAGLNGEDRDDQLRGVAEGGVQQPTQPRPGVDGQLLGRVAQDAGHRNHRQGGGDEQPCFGHMQKATDNRNGGEDQKQIEILHSLLLLALSATCASLAWRTIQFQAFSRASRPVPSTNRLAGAFDGTMRLIARGTTSMTMGVRPI